MCARDTQGFRPLELVDPALFFALNLVNTPRTRIRRSGCRGGRLAGAAGGRGLRSGGSFGCFLVRVAGGTAAASGVGAPPVGIPALQFHHLPIVSGFCNLLRRELGHQVDFALLILTPKRSTGTHAANEDDKQAGADGKRHVRMRV